MKLNEYLEKIKKSDCPQDCEHKFNKVKEIALVPPPDEILGIIVSRDPTVDWLEHHYRKEMKSRKELFDSAIPKQLFERINDFMANDITEEKKKHLYKFINKNIYWTHLHKCFTDKKGKKSIKFKNKNASSCADKWLTEELNIALKDKIRFIIALGNDVQKWICEWREDYCKNKNIKIINLPHPSPANVGITSSWNPETKDKVKIEKRINTLLELC